ncbi:vitelline membrane outer layer protein 1 homolog [Ruditapes philippinarum]|uniref:vitelline membrane outer layer protein 1 homolog n=1 Tax=Ruditapes philippinarum TaxID=129788 RepID=UPI00295B2BED|nr:vitelline membrane outer layer protein 1 homolog [Ruditapes philippinarum]
MKIEPLEHNDNTALNAIKLICANERGKYTGEVTSTQGRWGSWVGRINCNGHRHLAAFDLQVEKPQGRGDDTAANYVKFKCRCHGGHAYELVKPPGHGLWGKWGAWSDTCPKGSGICGIQTKVEKCQWHGDDTALNDVAFYCCKLPCNSDSLSD